MKFNKIKKYIEKINDNIDAAQDYRNKMALKSIISIGIFIDCYILHSYDILNFILYMVQFLSVFYTIYTAVVASFITYVEFVIMSKFQALSFGKGAGKMVVEQARDMALDSIREVKTVKTTETIKVSATVNVTNPVNKEDTVKVVNA